MRSEIREKILKKQSLTDFALENDIRVATLIDFLNGKRDIRVGTLIKILKPLKFKITDESETSKNNRLKNK
jgi:predicted transcriptional regulator